MWKLLVIAGIAAGCAGDDPHELGKCGDTWGPPITKCEAACEQKPDMTGPACRAVCAENDTSCMTATSMTCTATFTVDGQAGCCQLASGPTSLDVLFFECVE